MKTKIYIKRVYTAPTPDDGFRVFVDRLWVRGMTKEAAKIDTWAKELTPSNDLRRWLHEDRSRHPEFVRRYLKELEERGDAIGMLCSKLKQHPIVTLVTATKDFESGHTLVLKKFLEQALSL